MICVHCTEPIEKNTVKGGPEPHPTGQYKHATTRLFSCFNKSGEPIGRTAEPKEEK
jgi:hypothetical protein